MNRRSFLQYAGTGLFLIGGLSLMGFEKKLGANTAVRSVVVAEKIDGLTAEKVEILRLASLAPSSHNTQPWFVRIVDNGHWQIGTEKLRWLPKIDPYNRELLLSIGAFLENLEIAANVYGYSLIVRIVAENVDSMNIAEVTLEKAEAKNFSLDRLKNRCTVRTPFLNKTISKADIDFLTYGYVDQVAFCPPDSKEGQYLKQAVVEASRVQVFRNDIQGELAEWIRWSPRDMEKYRTGLTPDGMGIKGFDKWFVEHFYDKASVMEKRFRDQTLKKINEQVEACGGWLIVTSEDTKPEDLITTGRSFENMFLKARDKQIAFHPMSQVLEEGPWKYQIGQELNLRDHVQIVLRIGYLADYPLPVSIRMPVAWFVDV